MEVIRQKAGRRSKEPDRVEEKQAIKDLFKKFMGRVNNLSHIQKINLIYTYLVGRKPFRDLTLDKKLNRILYEQKFGEKIKKTKAALKSKGKSKPKFPSKWKQLMKRSKKTRDKILILYYRINGNIDMMLVPLFGTNMIIINSKPYEVDPRAFFRLGKFRCMSFKEIDRRPVSNLDYDEIRKRGDAVDSDEFLIKAAMRAMAVGAKKKPMNKGILIIVGIIALIIIGFLVMGGGGG